MKNYELTEKIINKIKKMNLNKSNVLTEKSIVTEDKLLISFIFYYQLRPKKCEICQINPEWNNKFLPFLIYRKNNNINDNRNDNIKILCPNCYYQKCHKLGNNHFIDPDKKDKKFINCIDCNRRFKKQVYNISLNLSEDNVKKHKYVKKRCNHCLDQNLVNINNSSKVKKTISKDKDEDIVVI